MRIGPFSFFEKKDGSSLANPDPALLALFGAGSEGTISRAQAMAIPAVNAAVRAISEAAATLGVNIVRIDDDGSEIPDNTHPVAKLLHGDVNEWTSGFELLRDLVGTALTNDNGGMAWVNRVDGKPQEIIVYRPGTMAVAYEDTGEPKYSINAASLKRDDVIHLRSPFNQCPLSLAMRAISVSWHLESHALNLFKKGARPGGVIEIPKMLGDEALKKMRAGWRAAFGGSENAGDTAVLWDGAKFVPMTLNSTDAQFLENRKFQVLEICRAFRVPPSMLFELDRATWSNGEQQGKEFLTYCLEPWLHALEVTLRRALFTPEERSQYKIVFDRDDLSRADLATRAAAINGLIASETINPNTGRDWLNLPPYAGGEVYGNRNININVDHAKPKAEPLKVAA
jgi:HK97 family phage portal protein